MDDKVFITGADGSIGLARLDRSIPVKQNKIISYFMGNLFSNAKGNIKTF
jgi:hypothetical protein